MRFGLRSPRQARPPLPSPCQTVSHLQLASSNPFALHCRFFAIAAWSHTRNIQKYGLVLTTACTFGIALAFAGGGITLNIPSALYVSSVLVAVGKTCGFCQWFRLLSKFDITHAKWLLIWGSLAHIALSFLLSTLPGGPQKTIAVFAICAPVGFGCLALSTKVLAPDHEARHAAIESAPFPSTLPLSILCGVALTLITPIASFAFGSTVTTPLPNAAIIALSHTVCLVILGFTWFGLRRDIPLTWLYCIFLPVFTSIIFLLFACNNETGWVILFIGNGCYFLVSLLMVITCLECPKQRVVSSLPLYGYLPDSCT